MNYELLKRVKSFQSFNFKLLTLCSVIVRDDNRKSVAKLTIIDSRS